MPKSNAPTDKSKMSEKCPGKANPKRTEEDLRRESAAQELNRQDQQIQ